MDARGLRRGAVDAAARLPALLAAAEPIAASMLLGAHGRRRHGHGDEFWQYRPAVAGDESRDIDWRRSGQSDTSYIRQREWQTAQNVQIWVDQSQSMSFDSHILSKADRAAIIGIALAMVLERGGERVGLLGHACPAKSGRDQIVKIASLLSGQSDASYGVPDTSGLLRGAQAVLISDFMGDMGDVAHALGRAVDRGVRGALVQVIDPEEATFPYDGRHIFEHRASGHRFDTNKASGLRDAYRERFAARQDALARLAHDAGWAFTSHQTDRSPQSVMVWLYTTLEKGARL